MRISPYGYLGSDFYVCFLLLNYQPGIFSLKCSPPKKNNILLFGNAVVKVESPAEKMNLKSIASRCPAL